MNALVLSGPNHGFEKSAPIIHEFLSGANGIDATLTDNAHMLGSSGLSGFDALVFGTGFSRIERDANAQRRWVSTLTDAQANGLEKFVESGKGLVGIHGTAWNISSRWIDLLGGSANWHPPGATFTVEVGNGHAVTEGVENFEVEDEIYMSAVDPAVETLATASWQNRNHPLAWTKSHGNGRVFYTALGHGPGTFEKPMMQRLMTQAVLWAGGA
ncbi:MAG: ThuA domain-containing protein [Candidatus Poribacteria bacterium]|nr:ThuA domain-containing protein [Candidatus Poribacteria bacterium]